MSWKIISNGFIVGHFLCRIPPWPYKSIIRPNLDYFNYLKVVFVNLRSWPYKLKVIDAPCCWITDDWSNNYFHWTLDCMLKLNNMEACEAILIPGKYLEQSPYIYESLQTLGMQVIPLDSKTIYWVRSVWVRPMLPYFSLTELLAFRKRIASLIQVKFGQGKRIYISRRIAQRRRLSNEENLEQLLKQHNFITCYPERLTWVEQVQLFASATHLVGLHGAGLTNIVYSQNLKWVIELKPAKMRNELFKHLCDNLHIPYSVVLMETNQIDFHGADLTLTDANVKSMENLLNLALNSEESA